MNMRADVHPNLPVPRYIAVRVTVVTATVTILLWFLWYWIYPVVFAMPLVLLVTVLAPPVKHNPFTPGSTNAHPPVRHHGMADHDRSGGRYPSNRDMPKL